MKKSEGNTDLEKCSEKLKEVLKEYNCFLTCREESFNLLLTDADTEKTIGFRGA